MDKNKKSTPQVINGKRWLYVINGFILLLFLGLIYAWSIFVAPLEAEFGWSRSETSMAFTICMCLFCIGGFASGIISKSKSPRFIIWMCAIFVLAGFLATARISSLIGLYICYGGFVGFGVGLAYNAVISTVTKWFPDKTGLVSGVLLMGFGFGGMALGTASTALIEILGWRNTFTGIGIVFAALIVISSFLIKPPSDEVILPKAEKGQNDTVQSRDFTTKEMLWTTSFWMIFTWAVVLTSAGLAMIGHASPCAIDMGVSTATAAVFTGLISVFNGSGRVVIGIIFDKIGRKKAMMIVSASFIVSGFVLMAALAFKSIPLLVAGYIFTGFSYSGIMPCNSTVISSFYGHKNYAMNFSMINMNIIIASPLGPFLAGVLQTTSGSYFTTFVAMAIFGAVAFVLNLFISHYD